MSEKKQLAKKTTRLESLRVGKITQRLLSLFMLLGAMVITLAIILFPQLLSGKSGKPDHVAALLLFWAMSAGYVGGIGYRPHNKLFFWMFSPFAFVLTLLVALFRVI